MRQTCILLILLLVASCLADDASLTIINATGATFPQPMYSEWSFAYQLLQPNTKIQYLPTGSGAGIKAIKANSVDFAGSDALLTAQEYNDYPDLQMFPLLAGAVVPNYNIPEITGSLYLDRDVLVDIFAGDIMYWNDSRILATNPQIEAQLPHQQIVVVVRKDKSGTTELFSKGLRALQPSWPYVSFEIWPQEILNRTNVVAMSGSYGVFAKVKSTPYSIGYLSLSFVIPDSSPYAYIRNREGEFVSAGAAQVKTAMDNVELNDKLTADITDQPGNAWPIAGYTYIIIYKSINENCEKRREMFKWFNWVLTDPVAVATAEARGYAPLSSVVVNTVLSTLSEIQCSGESLLQREIIPPITIEEKQGFFSLASVLLAYALVIAFVMVFHRESRVFKATGILFAVFTLSGAILNYIGMFFWTLTPEHPYICHLRVWFVMLGYSLLLGAMIAKSWVVHSIFHALKHDFKQLLHLVTNIKSAKVMKLLGILVAAQLIILICWSAVDPWSTEQVVVDRINLTSEWKCTCKHELIGWGFEIAFFAVLLLWGLAVSYITKGIKANYQESKYIILSIYNIVVCVAVFLPFVVSQSVSNNALYTVILIGIAFPTTFIVSIIYLQKIKIILRKKRTASTSGSENPEIAKRINITTELAGNSELDFGKHARFVNKNDDFSRQDSFISTVHLHREESVASQDDSIIMDDFSKE